MPKPKDVDQNWDCQDHEYDTYDRCMKCNFVKPGSEWAKQNSKDRGGAMIGSRNIPPDTIESLRQKVGRLEASLSAIRGIGVEEWATLIENDPCESPLTIATAIVAKLKEESREV